MYNIQHFEYETLPTNIPVDTFFGKSLLSIDNPNNVINDLIHGNEALAIYTDGSKTDSGFKCASISHQNNAIITRKFHQQAEHTHFFRLS